MDEWTEIRRKVLVERASKRSIHRDYGIGHQALAKILANAEPPGYQMAEVRAESPCSGLIWGPSSRSWPMTVRPRPSSGTRPERIFDRLRDEYGYTGCYSQVQTAVKNAKAYSKEAFVPLSHPPGHAQFDFGEATVEIAGERCKAALGVITLPYSDTYFLNAYPRSAPRPSRPPMWRGSSSSVPCRCGSPMTAMMLWCCRGWTDPSYDRPRALVLTCRPSRQHVQSEGCSPAGRAVTLWEPDQRSPRSPVRPARPVSDGR